jgi:hypothetical protein
MSLLNTLKSLFGIKTEKRPSSPRDRTLICEDCESKFIFDEGEQKFFRDKGFTDPKRCPRCRKKVRSRMRRRHRGGGGGGGGGHGGHHRGGGGRRHSVIDGDSPYADER